ncbi:LCP family protein required for cell wall assembly [Evansella vedderi]|uniref:LCP family protein required for cell wall assembly n=1 Tax=Evansella vedderi TaxID=38282 RepID=A0ABT9ZWJ7_9BACI|nr:LCP family protein [Evansella vedderi]MDQ0254515.1 LCP family protein required for cell wall assembly [Evansella vedderi]
MGNSRKEYKNQQKKGSKLRRVLKGLMIFTIVTLLIAGSAVGYMYYQLADVTSGAQQVLERGDRSEIRTQAVNPSKDNISILFLGLDDRSGQLRGRTDAMLLATFNEKEGSIKMLNIPRDSRVEIPGRGLDKINHAHAFGGIDLTIDTVEKLLNIPVDYFVSLNFDAFMEIVDTLGGVEVEVPFTFSEMDSNDRRGAITIYEGTQTLNGEEALAYVRMRKQDPRGDLGRGERQKQVLESIIRQGASFSSITNFSSLMDSLENHLKTNLSFGNILALHGYAPNLGNIESLSLDGTDSRINGIYYYSLDEESIADISFRLRVHLGLERAVVVADEEDDLETANQ